MTGMTLPRCRLINHEHTPYYGDNYQDTHNNLTLKRTEVAMGGLTYTRLGILVCVLALSFAASGCATGDPSQPPRYDWGERNHLANSVSMIELVSQGERFEEWPVRVTGVAVFDRETSLLFRDQQSANLDAESLFLDLKESLVTLGLSSEDLDCLTGRYVFVEGVFKNEPRSRLQEFEHAFGPQYAGTILQINRIFLLVEPSN